MAQELILSACSASSSTKNTATPAIQLHDLDTYAHVHSFKSSSSSRNCLSYAPSSGGVGGTVWSVQDGKAIAGIWAWQKDQQHLKLHLPERLACLTISPNRAWVAAGSPNGQIYLWEVASGLMLASWNAHYRAVTSLSFTSDSTLLISGSDDAAVHVFLVSRLLDDTTSPYGKPYGSFSDHTLAITALAVGRTAGCAGGNVFTASEDGTVKMWSLSPPFDLLATFSLPPGAVPSTLALDPTERFVYAGSTSGSVYLIPLFKRKAQLGQIEAMGGDGPGSAAVKADLAFTVDSPITCMTLSSSASQLVVGTRAGDIHIHSLPSHQHLRTLTVHAGPISHVSTMSMPPDLVGRPFRNDEWAVMDIKNLERMRAGRSARDAQEVSILLRPAGFERVDALRKAPSAGGIVSTPRDKEEVADTAALHEEIKRLKTALGKAVKLNEKMWNGVVDLKLGS